MSFRKVLFWSHLVAGVIAGVFVAIMCFTGATLAFEKQLIAWSERDARTIAPPPENTARLSIDELLRRAQSSSPDERPSSLTLTADARHAVAVSFGRDRTVYVDPYTGQTRTPSSQGMRDFLRTMENWHRWLALGGDARSVGKTINGVSNIAFCVLALTGIYLWLPRSWSWRSVRAVALFNWDLRGKARDFNWHNVIGIWSAVVLVVLTLTAIPMSFRWANALLYGLAGEAAPTGAPAAPAVDLPAPPAGAKPLDRDALFTAVAAAYPDWRSISLRLAAPRRPGNAPARLLRENRADRPAADRGRPAAEPAVFAIERPNAWPRTANATAYVNPFTGDLLRRTSFADETPGRRLRIWSRFLHTGEALGWPGQLVAGLACVGGCFLVYTGLALAWRRFFGRRATA